LFLKVLGAVKAVLLFNARLLPTRDIFGWWNIISVRCSRYESFPPDALSPAPVDTPQFTGNQDKGHPFTNGAARRFNEPPISAVCGFNKRVSGLAREYISGCGGC
jgi:hypothetical protein